MLLHAIGAIEELVSGTVFRIHQHAARTCHGTEVTTCEGKDLYYMSCEETKLIGECADILKDCCEFRAKHAANKANGCAGHVKKSSHGHGHGMSGYKSDNAHSAPLSAGAADNGVHMSHGVNSRIPM